MFNKVLIANRGAIAVRIIRTLKRMGIGSVVVYSEADADSMHIAMADEAYSLGSGPAAETYLDQDKLFAVIAESGAEAVHPGYGFLSENPDFARRCEQENVVFLGPTPKQMEAFGLKHEARKLAEQSSVPLLPGTALLKDKEEAIHCAEKIGFPVMLKSTAGGGGIGMQLCQNPKELDDAFDSVKRLSGNNFSNDGVFLEKFIESARHIEVQVFGDGQGKAVAFGERDCSSQRRNQKVIEETPAPNIPDNVRTELHRVAQRLAESIDYRNAGTVEYVYDQQSHQFYFLEVNTRLQVEHGVTEQVFGVDLVEWMILLGANELDDIHELAGKLKPRGHAVQMRLYAEDPFNQFQPSAGLLSEVEFPKANGKDLRIDHWVESGVEVSPFFDPMLAKVICWSEDRQQAINKLDDALEATKLYGVETNLEYVQQVLKEPVFLKGAMTTRFLNDFSYQPYSISVLSAGTLTTIQDFPGRTGYWDIGVPPSGPFDSYAYRLGNRLLGNEPDVAGLEITLNGPTLKFNHDTRILLAGAPFDVVLDKTEIELWKVINVKAGQTLRIGKNQRVGARCYLLIQGGLQCPDYLGSKSTFTLGQFGGHSGRSLRAGDVIHFSHANISNSLSEFDPQLIPEYSNQHELRVVYGPHGAPDFFTDDDIRVFFDSTWEVHYNSSRTGIRLIGPKPEWARTDGGEAGMHPSNIHDNAYAVGTIDFTGDMPVILGPDGPSLGGFVCPATVISADLWKLGQLKAGDKVTFVPVSIVSAVSLDRDQRASLDSLSLVQSDAYSSNLAPTPVLKSLGAEGARPSVVYRPSGDRYLLVEYGDLVLDINLRFRVHALMLWLQEQAIKGVEELTPGIRSLQIHYDSHLVDIERLLALLEEAEYALGDCNDHEVPARIVHLPLSWDDEVCRQAIEKYMQSVRNDSPWCPSNLEFIRRINGLDSIDEVKKIVFDANYLVMGLGDVYLGAPVATPLDPRHRLVTTKYNPARTWTAENSVGIGGSYLCIYGMEGPGGYQFIGRTLQMWNRYKETKEFTQPWLLRFFDQIKFYEVSEQELKKIRDDFPRGRYTLDIEHTTFSLRDYNAFIEQNSKDIECFTDKRQAAFDEELQHWKSSGAINFEAEAAQTSEADELELDANCFVVESQVSGSVWKCLVEKGQMVEEGQAMMVVESMKMEIDVLASQSGIVRQISKTVGTQVLAGQVVMVLEQV